MKPVFLLPLLVTFQLAWANNEPTPAKSIVAKRLVEEIKIDAFLDEASWMAAPLANEFTQYAPFPGKAPSFRSTVRMLYDDKAIYIAAELFDNTPDSISRQLSERDEIGVVDWFGFTLDSYQDGQNGSGFFVTAAGTQIDRKYTTNNVGTDVQWSGDGSWDAVWESKVRMTKEGWIVEIKLPYSALRFPTASVQDWNINFFRMVRRYREQSSWNTVDPKGASFLIQSGKLQGLESIKSPVRLSATPFVAGYFQTVNDSEASPMRTNSRSFNAGMDIKYGLNDAFTLDMTLIPDFGEADSDEQVLNLTQFEVRFDENRQFFTEGVELFNKGGLFYSRRVGDLPFNRAEVEDQLGDKEEIVSNPNRNQLINATKLSGRTKKGLGIGVFNAVESTTQAVVRNTETKAERQIQTNPLTNYNVFVLNQNLKNNSSISLINTNVIRNGAHYDANVTGTNFNLNDKSNTYSYNLGGVLSQKYFPGRTDLGHTLGFSGGKASGNLTYSLGYNEESHTYDPNDLGFLFNNNERVIYGNVNYNWYEPFGGFNNGRISIFSSYERLYKPNFYGSWGINLNSNFQTKKFLNFGVFSYVQPIPEKNYFAPRTEDFSQYIEYPVFGNGGFFISTDYRKKLALDLESYIGGNKGFGGLYYGISFRPRIQISDRLLIRPRLNYDFSKNDPLYVNTDDTGLVTFGNSSQKVLITEIDCSFVFNPKISFNLEGRHYWASVSHDKFFDLGKNGELLPSNYAEFEDINFNAFTIDAVFRWRFAPGSDIFMVWKNNFFSEGNIPIPTYRENWQLLRNVPVLNSFSLKVIYYLDYLSLSKG